MLSDFFALQWFLWDPVSSIKKPYEGLCVGESWKSKISVPTPMLMMAARDVVYTLDEIREGPNGRIAVIKSSYSLSESVPDSWPLPYSGSFRVSGRFGFLRGYKIQELSGEGEIFYNLDTGRLISNYQEYTAVIRASLRMGLSGHPIIRIDQNLRTRIQDIK